MLEFDPDRESLDILEGVIDPDQVQVEVAPDDEADDATGAAVRVLHLIGEAYASGKPQTRIPCPFCGRPLRYRRDAYGTLAECPSNDFVCMG